MSLGALREGSDRYIVIGGVGAGGTRRDCYSDRLEFDSSDLLAVITVRHLLDPLARTPAIWVRVLATSNVLWGAAANDEGLCRHCYPVLAKPWAVPCFDISGQYKLDPSGRLANA